MKMSSKKVLELFNRFTHCGPNDTQGLLWIATSSIGGRFINGFPVWSDKAPQPWEVDDGPDVHEWDVAYGYQVDDLLEVEFISGSSDSSLKAVKVDNHLWEVWYTPPRNDPSYKGYYWEAFANLVQSLR